MFPKSLGFLSCIHLAKGPQNAFVEVRQNFEGNGTIPVLIPFERAEEIFCRQLAAAQG